MSQKTEKKPQFFLFPKMNTSKNRPHVMYVRIKYQFSVLDKSLSISVNKSEWNHKTHSLDNDPTLNQQIQNEYNEHKEKIMGAYYILSQNLNEPTLREIFDLAFSDKKRKTYSFLTVFEDHIIQMRKRNTEKHHISNLTKYNTCFRHFSNFLKKQLYIKDISFNRINEKLIDDFEYYLKSEAANSHNSAMKMMQILKKYIVLASTIAGLLETPSQKKEFPSKALI